MSFFSKEDGDNLAELIGNRSKRARDENIRNTLQATYETVKDRSEYDYDITKIPEGSGKAVLDFMNNIEIFVMLALTFNDPKYAKPTSNLLKTIDEISLEKHGVLKKFEIEPGTVNQTLDSSVTRLRQAKQENVGIYAELTNQILQTLPDFGGGNVLHTLAKRAEPDLFKKVFESIGSDEDKRKYLSQKNDDGQTPLDIMDINKDNIIHRFAKKGDTEFMQQILEAVPSEKDKNQYLAQQNIYGDTPLDMLDEVAARMSKSSVMKEKLQGRVIKGFSSILKESLKSSPATPATPKPEEVIEKSGEQEKDPTKKKKRKKKKKSSAKAEEPAYNVESIVDIDDASIEAYFSADDKLNVSDDDKYLSADEGKGYELLEKKAAKEVRPEKRSVDVVFKTEEPVKPIKNDEKPEVEIVPVKEEVKIVPKSAEAKRGEVYDEQTVTRPKKDIAEVKSEVPDEVSTVLKNNQSKKIQSSSTLTTIASSITESIKTPSVVEVKDDDGTISPASLSVSARQEDKKADVTDERSQAVSSSGTEDTKSATINNEDEKDKQISELRKKLKDASRRANREHRRANREQRNAQEALGLRENDIKEKESLMEQLGVTVQQRDEAYYDAWAISQQRDAANWEAMVANQRAVAAESSVKDLCIIL